MNEGAARRDLSDWLLVFAVGAGLFASPAFALIFVAAIVRWGAVPHPPRWTFGHWLQVLSVAWALFIIATRPVGTAHSLLLLYTFLWLTPLILTFYRPTSDTVRRLGMLVLLIFAADFLTNLASAATGADIFGRPVDAREGIAGSRFGGLFGNSFYSGSISVLAYAYVLAQPRWRAWALLALANLLLAGSWRLLVAAGLIPFLMFFFQRRSVLFELLMVAVLSAGLVASVVMTSSLSPVDLEANPSNDLRVVAWALAIEKVGESPWTGVGYPSDRPETGVNFAEIDELLIAESWYLTAAITFGVPYMLLRLAAYAHAFYRLQAQRNRILLALVPFILIDFVYGGVFEGALVYLWMWVLLLAQPTGTSAASSALQARAGP